MSTPASASRRQPPAGRAWLARRVADRLGGRYSAELGIDTGAGDGEAERWFLAATLFGTRTTTQIAARTFSVLNDAGLTRIGLARQIPPETATGYFTAGGYACYASRAAALLLTLSEVIGERYGGRATLIGQRHTTYPGLRTALGVLPGWGPVTIQLFLRELRGAWAGARPPLDPRAEYAARHLHLTGPAPADLDGLARLAAEAGTDARDLESALVRLTFAHHRRGMGPCPGGERCTALGLQQQPGGSRHSRGCGPAEPAVTCAFTGRQLRRGNLAAGGPTLVGPARSPPHRAIQLLTAARCLASAAFRFCSTRVASAASSPLSAAP